MKINKRKLPIKYALEIYQEIPGYPSHEDLEYVLISTLQEKNLLSSKFTPEDVWSGFSRVLGTINDLRGFLEHTFQPDDPGDKIHMRVQGKKIDQNTYQLQSHVWCSE